VLTPNQAFIAHICLNTLNKSHGQDPKGTADWTELLDSGKTDGCFGDSGILHTYPKPVGVCDRYPPDKLKETWSNRWNDHAKYSSAEYFGEHLMMPATGLPLY